MADVPKEGVPRANNDMDYQSTTGTTSPARNSTNNLLGQVNTVQTLLRPIPSTSVASNMTHSSEAMQEASFKHHSNVFAILPPHTVKISPSSSVNTAEIIVTNAEKINSNVSINSDQCEVIPREIVCGKKLETTHINSLARPIVPKTSLEENLIQREELNILIKFLPKKNNSTIIIVNSKCQHLCSECSMSLSCKYFVNNQGKDFYICVYTCLIQFCTRKQINLLRFENVSFKNESNIIKQTPVRKCLECFKIIKYNNFHTVINWQTLEFCNVECLEQFQLKKCSKCILCAHKVSVNNIGRYCVRFGHDFLQFCNLNCLNKYKMAVKTCNYCQSIINNSINSFLIPLTNVNKEFCSLQCMELYEEAYLPNSQLNNKIEPCSICCELKPLKVIYEESKYFIKICSAYCLNLVKSKFNIEVNQCKFCNKYFISPKYSIYCDPSIINVCSKTCQLMYIVNNSKIVKCDTCNINKYTFDMILKKLLPEINMCSLFCLKILEQKYNIVDNIEKSCSICNIKNIIIYNMIIDTIVVNFCSRKCMNLFIGIKQSGQKIIIIPNNCQIIENQIVDNQNKPGSSHNNNGIAFRSHSASKLQMVHVQNQSEDNRVGSLRNNNSLSNQSILKNAGPAVNSHFTVDHNQPGCSKDIYTQDISSRKIKIQKTYHQYSVNPNPPTFTNCRDQSTSINQSIQTETLELSYTKCIRQVQFIQMSHPPIKNKSIACRPRTFNKKCSTRIYKLKNRKSQTNLQKPKPPLLPIPAPTYVAVSLPMFVQPTPTPPPIAISIPVSIFVPMDCNKPTENLDCTPIEPIGELALPGSVENADRMIPDLKSNIDIEQTLRANIIYFSTLQLEINSPKRLDNNQVSIPPKLFRSIFGVDAFHEWFENKKDELKKFYRKVIEKTDILQLTRDELNNLLSLFIIEVRKPDKSEYSADTIYYFCLGIQSYLAEHGRLDQIFWDTCYSKFITAFDKVFQKFFYIFDSVQYIVTKIEEEHLWETNQLGCTTPKILLFTLMYFNTKYFNLTTVDEHLEVTFLNIKKNYHKKNPNLITLQYCPPSTTIKARKNVCYEVCWNVDFARCPVHFFEFYLSKCPDDVKQLDTAFYMIPNPYCISSSPVWFTNLPFEKNELEIVLRRIKMVREINEAFIKFQDDN